MTKLVLGVNDIPYTDDFVVGRTKTGKPITRKGETGVTTGDVAEILEDKYGVMQAFWSRHGQEIGDALTSSLQGSLESMAMGAPPTLDPTGTAMSTAKQLFDTFITQKEMDGILGGVPTQASLDGVSHRFKNKKGAPGRPSFVDTGTYLASFVSAIQDG